MREISFTKMVASGNDFILTEFAANNSTLKNIAKNICDRKFGVGADGLLILEKSKIADVKMRIFNADGSEAAMCGNGARCAALYIGRRYIEIETKAGIIASGVSGDKVKIKLTDPKNLKLDIPIKTNNRPIKVNFINTGVPHTIIFVQGLDKVDVFNLGRQIRYHPRFKPAGTNVDFIEALSNNSIKIRTYERGVEDETLACGTGAVAASLIFVLKTKDGNKIKVLTKGKDILTVYFTKSKDKFRDVWLEGKAGIVYKGVYYV